MGFAGFGAGLVGLYDGLAADNSRAYCLAHKEVYERDVAAPLRALANALEPDFGEAKLFRPHRDVRFSLDKRPYQEHASLAVLGAGAGLYLQISPDGLMLAGGAWRPARDQLDRFRRAVDDEVVAAELDRTLARLARAGFPLDEGDPVATAPRGWSREHPRIDLLRRRSLTVSHLHDPAPWWHTSELLDVVRGGWRHVAVLNSWWHDHVGPSTAQRER